MEYWDAYDEHMNLIEGMTLTRGEPLGDGVFHLVCDIFLEHEDGTVLIMQRDPRIEYGGMWEATAGGSALRGETPLQCAQRELYEETGVRAKCFREYTSDISPEFHCIFTEFTAVTDCDKSTVKLQENETVSFCWVSREELKELKASGMLTERSCAYVNDLLMK
jgi:8-oxo-dGTP pyrophosphatase MutT (NUDIX family)